MKYAALLLLTACSSSVAPSLGSSSIFVKGVGVQNSDCRVALCPHNSDVDAFRWNGDIYLVHRTAQTDELGPNSSLRIYRSSDEAKSFEASGVILATDGTGDAADIEDGGLHVASGRDLRDPSFYSLADTLYLKALTRLPVTGERDTGAKTIAVESHTTDGRTWSPLTPIGPSEWSFGRVKEHDGVCYSAAYHDGDDQVALFASLDGENWAQGATIYGKAVDTPHEAELTFLPSGRLLALVRTDGTSDAATMTQVCWSDAAPYNDFHCDAPLRGVRLDGAMTFMRGEQLFVVARKQLGGDRQRTALYELTGKLEGGPIGIKEWFELPSAGDTAQAGGVALKSGSWLISWYSSDVPLDEPWGTARLDASDIWTGRIDFKSLSK